MKTKIEKDWLLYEREAQNNGYNAVCGVDEAGRGPLAGPVFAAAVILPQGLAIEGIDDSKKLSEKKREALYDEIKSLAVAFNVAFAAEKEIDEVNILNATFLAMKRAVGGLSLRPDLVLVDGNRAPALELPTKTIIKGDSLSVSIAAASILAKVERDRLMKKLSEKYPDYGLEKHKGYGTKMHVEAIKRHGPAEVHRKSFLKKILGE